MTNSERSANPVSLDEMMEFDRELFNLECDLNPQSMYSAGLEAYAERVWIPSSENVQAAIQKIQSMIARCTTKELLAKKWLESVRTVLELDEPGKDAGLITDTFVAHLVKEGVNEPRFKILADRLCEVMEAAIERRTGKKYSPPVMMLAQYQIIGAREILQLIASQSSDPELKEKIERLQKKVEEFAERFKVEGFTDGEFTEAMGLLKKHGSALGRESFYPKALRHGFDFKESPVQLEKNALKWISEDLPKLRKASRKLSKILKCDPSPEAVTSALKSKSGTKPEQALETVLKIRSIVQPFVAEKMVNINPEYYAKVVETPPYLSPIIPTGAAQGFDTFTDLPFTRFYLTTDPKRAPDSGFADLTNLLVHEEYGHCVHFSNTAKKFAAKASTIELLSSLHEGAISEGLSFQRELEFLDALRSLDKKLRRKYAPLTKSENGYVELTKEFGGFDATLLELEFSTYKHRIIRFLRVVGDVRINSGKQNLPEFLEWAEKKTGLSQRTVFYQIFPAHEGVFPGYAASYAVIGQEIKKIQRPIRNDPEKLSKFNAYACSMGYPPRSIFESRLRAYIKTLTANGKASRPKKRAASNKKSGTRVSKGQRSKR